MKRLSIIISTARDSDGCYSINNPNKHIFEDLFFSLQNQSKYQSEIELIIVDDLYQERNLYNELNKLNSWNFAYKIISPNNTFWRNEKLWHLNSNFNLAAAHSKGEYLFFASDCVHFPLHFLETFFSYLDQGYCPHSFFLFTIDNNLIVRNNNFINNNLFNFYNIPDNINYNTKHNGYQITDINYNNLLNNNFFNLLRFSDTFVGDGRLDNLIIKDSRFFEKINGKDIIHVDGSWYFGNMTMTRKDFFELNGYSQYFDGFKGLNDCEIGPRYFRLKKFNTAMENDHILAKDLYAFENLQKSYNKNILSNPTMFIDPVKLFLLMEKLKVIGTNNFFISPDILESVFLNNLSEQGLFCKKYYIENQPNFKLQEYI